MGRYYNGDDAKFTSSKIDFDIVRRLGNSGSDADPVNIFMVHWTTYSTATTIKSTTGDITDPGTMPNATVEVTIKDKDDNDLPNGKLLKMPADEGAVSPTDKGPLPISDNQIRYELLFKPTTNNQAAIDTIIFDDITFYYYATPKIVSWKYEQ